MFVLLRQNQKQTSSCQVQGAVETHQATPKMSTVEPSEAEYESKPGNTSGNTQTTGVFTESVDELDLRHRQDQEGLLELGLRKHQESPAQF